jgi:hypothetical protein
VDLLAADRRDVVVVRVCARDYATDYAATGRRE